VSTALIVLLIVWIVVLPTTVLGATAVAWRLSERRRARELASSTVMRMPDRAANL
jgi:hypothetical protein